MGAVPESTRARAYARTDELSFDGRNVVRIQSDDRAGQGTYVGVAVSLRDLVAHVLTPGDRSAFDLGAVVSAESDAVFKTADAPADFWRTVPVRVKVALEGFEPLEFIWRAADLPLKVVHLTPAVR